MTGKTNKPQRKQLIPLSTLLVQDLPFLENDVRQIGFEPSSGTNDIETTPELWTKEFKILKAEKQGYSGPLKSRDGH